MRKSIAAAAIIAAAAATACMRFHRGEDRGPDRVAQLSRSAHSRRSRSPGPMTSRSAPAPTRASPARAPKSCSNRLLVEVNGDKLSIRPDKHKGWFHMGWHPRQGALRRDRAAAARRDHRRVGRHQGRPGRPATRSRARSPDRAALLLASVEVQSLKLAIAGSGARQARGGTAKSAEYDIAGSGDIDADGLSAEHAKVSIAGSGSVKANATGTAKCRHHGLGRRRGHRRRQVQGQQSGLGQRALLLSLS